MPAYLIADIDVFDPALYDQYRSQVGATITAHGGRFLARGVTPTVLEGNVVPKRGVILEFPSMAALMGWYQSPEYQPLIALRQRAAKGSLVVMEGVPSA